MVKILIMRNKWGSVILLPAILIASLFWTGCRERRKVIETGSGDIQSRTEMLDSTYLFNGKNLDGWEITNFGTQGPVYVSGGQIMLVMGDGCTGITWKKEFPGMDYMITLEAKRVAGNDFFCGLTFPVAGDPLSLIVGGWGGATVGLSSIDGKDASENETTRLMKLESDRWYKICLIVKGDTVKALIDDEVVVDISTSNKSLSIRPEVELSKPFGIASWRTTAALRNIRLEKL